MSVETMSGLVEPTRDGAQNDSAQHDSTKRAKTMTFTGALLLFALPCALLLLLLSVYPAVVTGWQSLHDGDLIVSGAFVGLKNYVYALTMPEFWHTALFTLVLTVVGVFGSWVIGLALALFLRTRIPLSGVWRALLVLPWVIPVAASASAWDSLIETPQSPLPVFAHALGLGNVLFLADPRVARVVVCLFRVWLSFPFMMLMMSSALASVDRTVYEAARVDGASAWQTFRHITLPMISRTTYVSWILMAIFCVNDYQSIVALTAGGPEGATQTLVVMAYQFENPEPDRLGAIGPGTAMAFLTTVMLVTVSVLLYRRIRKSGDWTVDGDSLGSSAGAGAGVRGASGPGRWWRLVAMVFIVALVIAPVCQLVYSGLLGGGTLNGFLANIESAFHPAVLSMFWRSLVLASVTVVVCIVVGAPAGYAIARGRGRALSAFTLLTFSVQSFPMVALLFPMFVLLSKLHLIDTLFTVQLAYIGVSLGFAVWMFSAFLKTMPIEIEEAAWADGCSVAGAFFRVVLPNAVPALLSTGIFVFLLAWGDFQIVQTLIVTQTKVTLSVGDPLSLLFLLPPLVIFFVFNRYFSLGGVAASFSRR